MTTEQAAPEKPSTDEAPPTLPRALLRTAEEHGDEPALRGLDGEIDLTWSELLDRVKALAGGFSRQGVGRGDAVALMLNNRPELHLSDLALAVIGATPFSVYQTSPPDDIKHLIENSGARLAVVEQDFLESMQEAQKSCDQLEKIVLVEGDGPEGTLDWTDLEEDSEDFDVEASAKEVEPDDILTLIYTSGTTGPSKGVELTHRNLIAAAQAVVETLGLESGQRVISWLPTAHIAERLANYYIPVLYGLSITCCPDPGEITKALSEVHPHWFFAVPRQWEKLKQGIEQQIDEAGDEQREKMEQAIETALDKVRKEREDEDVDEDLANKVNEADEELFAPLRGKMGLDQFVALNAGGAPASTEMLEYLHAVGLPVGELWGASEVCGAATINPPDRVKIGTVGVVLPGYELKLAEDGEILLRGDAVMKRYRGEEEKTEETFDDDGWLETGDIGEMDDDGYLKLVDRKKELIINSAGKNMSPTKIESAIKDASELIDQVVAVGNDRKYNVALITLDKDTASSWAKDHDVEDDSLEALADDDSLYEEIEQAVEEGNEKLARVEQIKKFEILGDEWEAGGDELTPTMKLRRKAIEDKYSDQIEALYSE